MLSSGYHGGIVSEVPPVNVQKCSNDIFFKGKFITI